MGALCQFSAFFWLHEGVAAGKGDAVQQGIFCHSRDDVICISPGTAVGVMGLRIMATGAMMRASLCEYRQANTGAVNDGIPGNAAEADFHKINLPLPAVLLLLQRSVLLCRVLLHVLRC